MCRIQRGTTRLALTRFEPWILFVDHINTAATTHTLGLWLRTHKYTVKLTFKGRRHGDGVKGQISRYSFRLPKRLCYASAEAESAEAARLVCYWTLAVASEILGRCGASDSVNWH